MLLATNGTTNSMNLVVLTIDTLVNTWLLPIELIVGFACQFVNCYVLRQNLIRNITYTSYLRSLSLIYLLVTPFLLVSLCGKSATAVFAALSQSYAFVFYAAYLERYIINVLLFSGNLLASVFSQSHYHSN